MKNRARRVEETKLGRGSVLAPLAAGAIAAAIIAGSALFALSGAKDGSRDSRAPAGSNPAVASFAYERSSDLGDLVRYAIDCPGIPLCSVEISENGKTVGKAQIGWETIEPFFLHYGGSPLVRQPRKTPDAPARTLVRYSFKMSGVEAEGVITDQTDFRRVIPYWDAMFASFL